MGSGKNKTISLTDNSNLTEKMVREFDSLLEMLTPFQIQNTLTQTFLSSIINTPADELSEEIIEQAKSLVVILKFFETVELERQTRS